MLNRMSRSVIASGRLGISGTRISKMLEGMWVKTMVLMRPKRCARREAVRAEMPAINAGSKENGAQDRFAAPKRMWNQ